MRATQSSRDRGLLDKVQVLLLLGIGMVAGSVLSGLLTTPASLYAQSTSPLTIQPDTGRVGIGTTNPGATLHVQGDGQVLNIGNNSGTSARYAAFDTGASGGVYVGIDSSAGGVVFSGTGANSGSIGTTGAFPFHIATQNSVKVTIDHSGKLGIGTTAPTETLDVVGNAKVSGTIRGATYGFGGMFTLDADNVRCWSVNAWTGACSCPTGFTQYPIWGNLYQHQVVWCGR